MFRVQMVVGAHKASAIVNGWVDGASRGGVVMG